MGLEYQHKLPVFLSRDTSKHHLYLNFKNSAEILAIFLSLNIHHFKHFPFI
jgi:hypothetical protein